MTDSKIAILLLAAGSSSRMGKSKQLLSVNDMPLLRKSVLTACEVTGIQKIVVVLGARSDEHSNVIQDLPIEIIINNEWQNGMGSSLKKGLSHQLKLQPDLNGVIIMVCDQPAVSKIHLEKLIRPHLVNPKSIIASHYGETIGVPALFSSNFFQPLLQLNDEQGAKKVIQEHSQEVIAVELPDGEIDLDTLADYQLWLEKNKK